MSKIAYATKVGVEPRTVHINQVWDADMNEIKAVVNDNAEAGAVNGNTTFVKPAGSWVNSPSSPWVAGTIPLVLTNAVSGGRCFVWFQGVVELTTGSFTGGTVQILSGVNVPSELCLVEIVYDLINDIFTAIIHATGGGSGGGSNGISKYPGNTDVNNLEINDMLNNVWWDTTLYIKQAQYLGGDISLIGSYNLIDTIEY